MYLRGNAFWHIEVDDGENGIVILREPPFFKGSDALSHFLKPYNQNVKDSFLSVLHEIQPMYDKVEHIYWMYEFFDRLHMESADVSMEPRVDVEIDGQEVHLRSGDYHACLYSNGRIVYNTSVMYQENYDVGHFLLWHPILRALKEQPQEMTKILTLFPSFQYHDIPMMMSGLLQQPHVLTEETSLML